MNIRFNRDGSIKRVSADEFIQQLSSGQRIEVSVEGTTTDEYRFTAFGILPNGEGTNLSYVTENDTYNVITLNSDNTKYNGKLIITIQISFTVTHAVFTYPLYLTINPIGISDTTEFPITLDEVTTFLSQLQNYPTKTAADARFQQKFSLNTMRVYNNVEDLTADFSKLIVGQLYAVRNDSQISLFYKNQIGSTVECFVTLAGKAEQDSEGNIIHEVYATKESVENLQSYLEGGTIIVEEARYAGYDTLTGERLASKPYVDTKIGTMSSHYVTSDSTGDNFSNKAALLAGPYYYAGELHTPDQNDYAFVEADESHEGKAARYVYQGEQWNFQYVIPTPVAGVTDVKVDGESVLNAQKVAEINLDSKLDKVGWPDNADRLYGVTEAGNQAIYKVGDGLLSNLVVRRNADAQILVPLVPTNEYHSTSKSYVDSHSIKEISTQDINLWDLEVGIYKLTYNGDKYLHYNGAYPTIKVAISGNSEKLLYISKSWVGNVMWECADDIGNTRYGYSASNSGAYYQAYMYSPVNKINGSQNQITSGIYAPTANGQPGTVLIAKENEAPTWDYLRPYTMIYTIDLSSSNTITIDIRNDFPMFNGRDDILVEIMPQDMLDEWVENNVTFEETHPGYFHGITFTAESTLSAPVKVLVKAQVKGTI